MLPKAKRMSHEEVEKVFAKGKVFYTKHFVLKAAKNREAYSRFCITFSKKLSLKAHQRNTIRRRIYESIRKNSDMWPKNLDVAFIVKPSLVEVPRKELESHVKNGLFLLQQPQTQSASGNRPPNSHSS